MCGSASRPRVSTIASAALFNPATGTWSATGSLQDSRYIFASGRLPNGKVVVAGGDRVVASVAVKLSSAEQ